MGFVFFVYEPTVLFTLVIDSPIYSLLFLQLGNLFVRIKTHKSLMGQICLCCLLFAVPYAVDVPVEKPSHGVIGRIHTPNLAVELVVWELIYWLT